MYPEFFSQGISAITLLLSTLIHPIGNSGFEMTVGAGYREDHFNWSIAGPNRNPDVLSELDWKDLKSVPIDVKAKLILCDRYLIKFEGDYAKIFQGRNRDSDYLGNNRTEEFSRSISDAGRGELFDLSGAIGRRFSLFNGFFTFSPMIGYSHNEQHLRIFDGNQVINSKTDEVGPFKGLHSSYKAKWRGPWGGLEVSLTPFCPITFYGSVQYHALSYRGKGHWNLREEFVKDFLQHSYGYGFQAKIGCEYQSSSGFLFGIASTYRNFQTFSGLHKAFLETDLLDQSQEIIGKIPFVAKTRFNPVRWESLSVIAYVGFKI